MLILPKKQCNCHPLQRKSLHQNSISPGYHRFTVTTYPFQDCFQETDAYITETYVIGTPFKEKHYIKMVFPWLPKSE